MEGKKGDMEKKKKFKKEDLKTIVWYPLPMTEETKKLINTLFEQERIIKKEEQ